MRENESKTAVLVRALLVCSSKTLHHTQHCPWRKLQTEGVPGWALGVCTNVCCIPLLLKKNRILHQPPWLENGILWLLPCCSQEAMQQLLKTHFWVSCPPGALVSYENRVQRASCGKFLELIHFCKGEEVGVCLWACWAACSRLIAQLSPILGERSYFPSGKH